MKRFIIISLALVTSLLAHAEWEDQAVGFSIGYTQNICRLNSPSELSDDKTKLTAFPMNGTKIGFIYDANIWKGLGFSVSANYSYTAQSSDWTDYPYDIKGNVATIPTIETKYRNESHVIEVNLHGQYKVEIAMNTWLILYTGPTWQNIIEFNANAYFRNKLTQESQEVLKIRSDQYELSQYYKPLNLAWGLGGGFQYKNIWLRGGYDFGLTNPRSAYNFGELGYLDEDGYPDSRRTRGRWDQWQIRIGFYFWHVQ